MLLGWIIGHDVVVPTADEDDVVVLAVVGDVVVAGYGPHAVCTEGGKNKRLEESERVKHTVLVIFEEISRHNEQGYT